MRDEASGAYQERSAEEARYRKSSIRAERRGEGKQTMKHEQVESAEGPSRRLCRRRSDEGRARRRFARDVRRLRGAHRARWSADIADVPIARPPAAVLKAGDCQELALAILQGKAAALRKAQPDLSESQAFSRVYTDPSMPKSRRLSVPQPARDSRNRRPPHTRATTCKRTLPSQSVTTRSTH